MLQSSEQWAQGLLGICRIPFYYKFLDERFPAASCEAESPYKVILKVLMENGRLRFDQARVSEPYFVSPVMQRQLLSDTRSLLCHHCSVQLFLSI